MKLSDNKQSPAVARPCQSVPRLSPETSELDQHCCSDRHFSAHTALMVLTFLYFHSDWFWDRYLDTFRVREHAGLSQHASKQPERFGTAMSQPLGFEAPKYPKELWGER